MTAPKVPFYFLRYNIDWRVTEQTDVRRLWKLANACQRFRGFLQALLIRNCVYF